MKNVPKIAAIHDMSGMGRCSMTVIMPVLSALGCQVCPLPTALLSNHSKFENFYFFDFTEHMEEYYLNWEKNNAEFDCVYSGFIGSEKQIDILIEIINKIKAKRDALVVVDPVMGDDGITYKTYTDKMVEKMSRLVNKADIITPNMTEVSILLGEKYSNENISTEILKLYLNKLCSLGPDIAVITGVTTEDGENINACYDKKNNEYWKIPFQLVGKRYPGTGDLFTSLFVGYLMKGKELPKAIEEASRFVSLAVKETFEAGTPCLEGVMFEKIMKELYTEIENYNYTKI
ncbi:MAG: pyridoxamine kinase [Sedimentibacter sp.]|uniref:pyridoxamine kinase n=1 Tax=Sedimentibacter sp. TaxID=1960295 RepID=UPI002981BF6C|nr:pyridoxamine kinase [Sedimentibacter sp.]MDW5299324.1 pyridoxamine kinase [Sedimentibacter sp.]